MKKVFAFDVETLDRVRLGLPPSLHALDVDNRTEFVSDTMIQCCLSYGIELTRSRHYRKTDQAELAGAAIARRFRSLRRPRPLIRRTGRRLRYTR